VVDLLWSSIFDEQGLLERLFAHKTGFGLSHILGLQKPKIGLAKSLGSPFTNQREENQYFLKGETKPFIHPT
jgi:hypothetical protein